ncbi:AMP-binding protein [Pseudorhodoferax sp. Leaf274]|uniref:AMP-binding protein n=1 Tax=Pseudorhodoferax sp. Leaf274 TaxID=1736318 RepID=UPI00070352D2|nr:AMP-binding protein [Pseudorhodoferax sp. Leaf274]KQP49204.1 2-aminobenzoate-CoA ligase [Pseudorhodoferax sp. Leaf274]
MHPSAHVDTFARDHLPPAGQQPDYLFDLPALQFPARLNCASELLDRHVAEGRGQRVAVRAPGLCWTYAELQAAANRIANVLVQSMGLVPGNRVLLRAPNNPMLVACWFAVAKAGGIAVATMPLLRAKELGAIVRVGQVTHALCDAALAEELRLTVQEAPGLGQVRYFHDDGPQGLEAAMARASPVFENVATASDDCCIFGFTSGTTGVPKATMHYHRDVMAICACWPPHLLRANADDVFIGSPPLAFTFGLGGLVLFPMAVGASTVLLEKAGPQQLLQGIQDYGATVCFTAPTSYRQMAASGELLRRTPLRKCVSAGEALPASARALWKQATGIELIDGIGATEMLHIFISHDEATARPGATGKPVPGYRAKVVDEEGRELPPGTVGKLAVQGPTGCRYLADARQQAYVRDGWNITGDAYLMDADGYFHYQARTDDMIVSAGYNIAAPEVEDALLAHPDVAECGVVGQADAERGQIVKAFVVLRPGCVGDAAMVRTLQDFVKRTVAPYKYPRSIVFLEQLPRTSTGKLQRFKLHAR